MFMRTERLFLRPVFPEDWRGLYRAIADERIVRNLARAPWPYTKDDARHFCAASGDGPCTRFAIILPDSKDAPIVGMVGFEPDENGSDELGYWIGAAWQGQGFATEAVSGVIAIAEAIGRPALQAGHFLDNPASGHVLQKTGFQPTGELRETVSAGRGGRPATTRRLVRPLGETLASVCPAAA